ncbi:hypothetical protein JB92DRAFT_3085329 [Gautieria morchelliformis]|nr:hypothetical protein JB92DRAFT_3085329 [Gautieria morchelliformis]
MLRTVTSFSCATSYRLPRLSARRSYSSEQGSRPDATASSQLWADAVKEEADSEGARASSKPPTSTQPTEYPNWTGNESVQDAVLRMLVDKYKPLRGGVVRTAEEKLKSAPPDLASLGPSSPLPSSESSVAAAVTSTLEGSTTHKPWLTTFRAPSHATSIRHMRLPPPLPAKPSTQGPPVHPDDTRSRNIEREKKKKAAHAGRLTNARDSSLDYRIGKTATAIGDPRMHRPNAISVKGWRSLVEERIERARSEGHFRSIKGRGKPLVRDNEQSNPFIPREEFLMNRIVQRQGVAPPWVEFQAELDAALSSFRRTLQATWTRRAVRSLMHAHLPGVLPRLTLSDVTGRWMRDREWEGREKGYHEAAVREINALVRKYNGVAPYAVRRTYLTREAELQRMYTLGGEDILAEIRRKSEAGPAGPWRRQRRSAAGGIRGEGRVEAVGG